MWMGENDYMCVFRGGMFMEEQYEQKRQRIEGQNLGSTTIIFASSHNILILLRYLYEAIENKVWSR
jgi:hypothetical protein